MIVLLRVDHRLLHGQVVFSWVQNTNTNCVLVANDNIVNDEIRKSTLKLAKPGNVKLVIKNIADSVEAINSGITDKYNLMILVDNIYDAYLLAKNCKIKSINLGGLKSNEDTVNISNSVNITKDEIKLLNELLDKDIEIEIRQLPNDIKKEYKKIEEELC